MVMTQISFEWLPRYPTVQIAPFFCDTSIHNLWYRTTETCQIPPLCSYLPQRAHFSNNICGKGWQANGAPCDSWLFICDGSFGHSFTTGYGVMFLYTAQRIFSCDTEFALLSRIIVTYLKHEQKWIYENNISTPIITSTIYLWFKGHSH